MCVYSVQAAVQNVLIIVKAFGLFPSQTVDSVQQQPFLQCSEPRSVS